MALAIFDLDNTLLNGDSDNEWGAFVATSGLVDADAHNLANAKFYDDYKRGELDIHEYGEFVLAPLVALSDQQLAAMHDQFMATEVPKLLQDNASKLIQFHKDRGDTLLVITATNRLIVEPIVKLLGIDNLLATDPEIIDGKLTGKLAGTPCYQDGKVERLAQWQAEHGLNFDHTVFYSDSFNDLPLLNAADEAIAVDPDDTLMAAAQAAGWMVISLRD